jgi:ligand-binding SRPBCC domain-containing protein
MRRFETELWLPARIEVVFDFFSKAENLNEITPPSLHFQMLTPTPVEMKKGTLLDYRLRVHGVPVRWQTEIIEWEPPHKFVDRQNRGPYKNWIHTHVFEPQNDGTFSKDIVDYEVPGWFLEPLIHRFLIAPDLERIFAYRTQKLRERFA